MNCVEQAGYEVMVRWVSRGKEYLLFRHDWWRFHQSRRCSWSTESVVQCSTCGHAHPSPKKPAKMSGAVVKGQLRHLPSRGKAQPTYPVYLWALHQSLCSTSTGIKTHKGICC